MDYALIAEESVVLDLRSGTTKVIPCNGRSGIALAASLSDENERTAIGVRGMHVGLTIGAEAAGKQRSATKTNGQAVANIDFIGDTDDAVVRGISIGQNYTPSGKANRDFSFQDLTIDARMLQVGLLTHHGVVLPGTLAIKRVRVWAQNKQGVNRTKWPLRHNSSGTKLEIEELIGGDYQEHLIYADALQDGSYIQDCYAWNGGRTMIQIVDRFSTKPGGEDLIPSSGTVRLSRNVAENIGYYTDEYGDLQGEGASAFTCAGHRGTLILDGNVHIDTEGKAGGSVVVFMDRKMLELDPADSNPKTSPVIGDGHALTYPDLPGQRFGLERLIVLGNNSFTTAAADRDCVAISAVRTAEIYPYSVNSNKCPLHFEANGQPVHEIKFRGRVKPSLWVPTRFGGGDVKRDDKVLGLGYLDSLYAPR